MLLVANFDSESVKTHIDERCSTLEDKMIDFEKHQKDLGNRMTDFEKHLGNIGLIQFH